MPPPRYRRPAQPLSPEQVSRLVAMREQGATWMQIGRVFSKQDHACKMIFDKAQAEIAAGV